jgi:hypothetical protein
MKSALLLLLRAYKRFVSPLLLPSCRYEPTCSEYAAEEVEFHGPAKGAMLAAWRLLRCHPFSRGGFDPVPVHVGHMHVAHAPSRVQPSNQARVQPSNETPCPHRVAM